MREFAIKGTETSSADAASIAENFLFEVREQPLPVERTISMPIGKLSSLGSGIASVAPMIEKAISSTSSTGGASTYYRIANAGVGESLKIAKDGKLWGALNTANGGSKFAKFEAVNPESVASGANIPMLLMAVAIFSIEKELEKIEEMEQEILSFLEIEKESEIEADVITLNEVISKYKYNWDNEHYVLSNHKLVCDIQRTARKNIISFQKSAAETIRKKKLINAQSNVKQSLGNLQKKFQYYRLSVYVFSLASMIEILLGGNFKEENISNSLLEIRKYSDEYRELFAECSIFLEKMTNGSIETNALKGIGIASDKIGKIVGSIPKISDGQVDEFLQKKGERLQEKSAGINKEIVRSFAKVSDPNTRVFTEKMEEMIQIYDKTSEICFDKENLYLISG